MPLLASVRVLLRSARIGALSARSRTVWALVAGLMLSAALAAALVPRARAGVRRPAGLAPPAVSAAAAPSERAAGLHVTPLPGTPDAASNSAITFSSLSPSDLRSVVVTGSRSGVHLGRIDNLPGDAGAEFVPRRAFAPGERVAVTARLASPADGTASGAPGATRLRFSFGVAVLGPWSGGPPQDEPSARVAGGSPTKYFHS